MQRAITGNWTARIAIGLVSAAIVACSPAPAGYAPITATPAPVAGTPATPTVSTAASVTRVPPTRPAITPSGVITLTVWMVEELAPGPTPAGRIWRNQLDAFTAANRNINIQVVPKKSSGKGGLLDFLLTTRDVMPERLPDLIALDLSDIPPAANASLLQPLDGLMPAEMNADFFPFAARAARYHNQWIAVPFAADAEHLVYNKAVVRKPPANWDELAKQKGSFLAPFGGDDAFLLQYFGLGATLDDASDQVALDPNATAQVLAFFARMREAHLLPEVGLNVRTVDEAWTNFAAGQAAMAQVSASRYLTDRAKTPNALYAPVPTREGKVTALANGWAFAMITPDPARQAAVARFLVWIVQGERLAPWLRAAHLLPTQRSSVQLAIDPPEYASFLRDELENGATLPAESLYARQAEAWRSAIAAVWKGQTTAEQAARDITGAK